jgi:hypothetical protein
MGDRVEAVSKPRGAAMVRAIIEEERDEMESRVYVRARPYLVGALRRLRQMYPNFKTVVFRPAGHRSEKALVTPCVLVFDNATRHKEAPSAFRGLLAACGDLAQLRQIETLTARDAIWQCRQRTPQPTIATTQYRSARNDWKIWITHSLSDARRYMRQDMYSRAVYGSHSPGYGKRIVDESGAVIDEWTDPAEAMIVRSLREVGGAGTVTIMEARMNEICGFRDGFYFWDLLRICDNMQASGVIRRVNPKASECNAKFALRKIGSRP